MRLLKILYHFKNKVPIAHDFLLINLRTTLLNNNYEIIFYSENGSEPALSNEYSINDWYESEKWKNVSLVKFASVYVTGFRTQSEKSAYAKKFSVKSFA